MTALFTPFRIGTLELTNRIVIAPMCQYSAVDGCMTDWHVIHLGHLALSGAGLLTIEATAILPEARITYADVGLWNDATEAAIGRTLESIRRWSDIPIAIQLAHAGRKASTEVPWKGGVQIPPDHPNGWQTFAPSAVPFEDGQRPPIALDRDGLTRVREAFAAAAQRARDSGLTPSSYTVRMATCCTSSSRRSLTDATMSMAAAWRTACAFRSKSLTRCAPPSQPTARFRCACPALTGQTTAGTLTRRSPLRRSWRRAAAPPFTYRAAVSFRPSTSRSGRVIRCHSRGP